MNKRGVKNRQQFYFFFIFFFYLEGMLNVERGLCIWDFSSRFGFGVFVLHWPFFSSPTVALSHLKSVDGFLLTFIQSRKKIFHYSIDLNQFAIQACAKSQTNNITLAYPKQCDSDGRKCSDIFQLFVNLLALFLHSFYFYFCIHHKPKKRKEKEDLLWKILNHWARFKEVVCVNCSIPWENQRNFRLSGIAFQSNHGKPVTDNRKHQMGSFTHSRTNVHWFWVKNAIGNRFEKNRWSVSTFYHVHCDRFIFCFGFFFFILCAHSAHIQNSFMFGCVSLSISIKLCSFAGKMLFWSQWPNEIVLSTRLIIYFFLYIIIKSMNWSFYNCFNRERITNNMCK